MAQGIPAFIRVIGAISGPKNSPPVGQRALQEQPKRGFRSLRFLPHFREKLARAEDRTGAIIAAPQPNPLGSTLRPSLIDVVNLQ